MNNPTFFSRTIPAIVCLLVIHLASTMLVRAQEGPEPGAVIDQCDGLFVAMRKSMRSIPQSTLQAWVRAQNACAVLTAIAADSTLSREHRLRARYSLAFGYGVLGLYDFSHQLGSALADDALAHGGMETALIVASLNDAAQSLERMGRFDTAAKARRRALEIAGDGTVIAHNNLAFVLLKAGHYEECLKFVELIELSEETAHTRVFSARANAYLGRYERARDELRKACGAKEQNGCEILKSLDAAPDPAAFWSADKEGRTRLWAMSTVLDPASSISAGAWAAVNEPGVAYSVCAPSYWFNEFLPFYDASSGALRYPPLLARGRAGMCLVGGVPFLFALTGDGAAPRDSLRTFAAAMHGPSAFDRKMPLRNRALVRANADGSGLAAVFVHSDEQAEFVRARLKGEWEELK